MKARPCLPRLDSVIRAIRLCVRFLVCTARVSSVHTPICMTSCSCVNCWRTHACACMRRCRYSTHASAPATDPKSYNEHTIFVHVLIVPKLKTFADANLTHLVPDIEIYGRRHQPVSLYIHSITKQSVMLSHQRTELVKVNHALQISGRTPVCHALPASTSMYLRHVCWLAIEGSALFSLKSSWS